MKRAEVAASLPVLGTCKCGTLTATVQVAGSPVLCDRDADPRGDVHGMKIGGRWIFTLASTANANTPTRSYRRHRCAVTRQEDLRRAADQGSHAGPCRGYCGTTLPNVYGQGAVTMCDACVAKRNAR